MARSGPPAYAWDWFARQRLLWREVRSRLAASATPAAARYHAVDTKAEVVAMLRADHPRDEVVRAAVDRVVAELAFLGRTDRDFAQLGIRAAPRGMRWWWTALTGEDLDQPRAPTTSGAHGRPERPDAEQLALVDVEALDQQTSMDDVLGGYGG
jgi:hypothetical protein